MKPFYLTIFAVLATYLIFTFGTASFDISTWSEYARSGCATAMATIALIGAYVTILLNISEGI